MLNSTRSGAVLGLLVVSLSCNDWREADDFEAVLTCGMRLEDVKAAAREHGVPDVEASWFEAGENAFAVKPGELRFVDVAFGADGLKTVQAGSFVPLTTGIKWGLKRNLCTGEEVGCTRLDVRAPLPYKGARLRINSAEAGIIGSDQPPSYGWYYADVCVPLGEVHIALEASGLATLEATRIYQPRGRWTTSQRIEVDFRP